MTDKIKILDSEQAVDLTNRVHERYPTILHQTLSIPYFWGAEYEFEVRFSSILAEVSKQ